MSTDEAFLRMQKAIYDSFNRASPGSSASQRPRHGRTSRFVGSQSAGFSSRREARAVTQARLMDSSFARRRAYRPPQAFTSNVGSGSSSPSSFRSSLHRSQSHQRSASHGSKKKIHRGRRNVLMREGCRPAVASSEPGADVAVVVEKSVSASGKAKKSTLGKKAWEVELAKAKVAKPGSISEIREVRLLKKRRRSRKQKKAKGVSDADAKVESDVSPSPGAVDTKKDPQSPRAKPTGVSRSRSSGAFAGVPRKAPSASSSSSLRSPDTKRKRSSGTAKRQRKGAKGEVLWWSRWHDITGRGRRSVRGVDEGPGGGSGSEGEEIPTMTIESTSTTDPYLSLIENSFHETRVACGCYDLTFEVQNVRTDRQIFFVALNYSSSSNYASYISITMNSFRKEWRAEEVVIKKRKKQTRKALIARAEDSDLSPGQYYRVSVMVRNSRITVESSKLVKGGRRRKKKVIFSDLTVIDNGKCDGRLGIGVYQTKTKLRNLNIRRVGKKRGSRDDGASGGAEEEAPRKNPMDDVVLNTLPSHIDPHFAEAICRDIIQRQVDVRWDDIGGLTTAKKLLKEAVILPMLLPEFFIGIRRPWAGVLLGGPPGTGKTLLAKAVATEAKTTFFNVSASTVVSKWHGESERLVKCLFQLARFYAPSTIFFDEIDALMLTRGTGHEHEASRRFKSELLSQIDGIHSDVVAPPASAATSGEEEGEEGEGEQPSPAQGHVMILATSNKPWDLDEAMRRRLEKRIYVPLPDPEARKSLFKLFLKDIQFDDTLNFAALAERSEGFSGADIKLVCRDAAMVPLRRAVLDKSPDEIVEMKSKNAFKFVIGMPEFDEAFHNTKPSVNKAEISKFVKWFHEFGSQ